MVIRICLRNGWLPLVLIGCGWFGLARSSFGQDKPVIDEMKLIERVAELQRELEAVDTDRRDAAEKALVELGVAALDYLEPTTEQTPSDAVIRNERVRKQLERLAVMSVTQPGRVTIDQTMTVNRFLAKLGQQTGNQVLLPPGLDDSIGSEQIQLKLENATFWESINQLSLQTRLVADPFASDKGVLRLTPGNPIRQDIEAGTKVTVPRDVSSIFDVSVQQVTASRNLLQPNLNYCNVRIRVRWEPRLTPISVSIPAKSIQVIDEFDGKIKVSNPDAVYSATVQSEIPELEFSIPIELVDRQIETIKSLDAQINAIIPGRNEKFKFRNLGRIAPGAEQTKAGVVVGYQGIRKNEDLYGVTISLGFENKEGALESHLNWVYQNQLILVDDDGNETRPIAFESAGQTADRVSVQYYFDRDPAAMSAVYETPAAIVPIPIRIRLLGIPLP